MSDNDYDSQMGPPGQSYAPIEEGSYGRTMRALRYLPDNIRDAVGSAMDKAAEGVRSAIEAVKGLVMSKEQQTPVFVSSDLPGAVPAAPKPTGLPENGFVPLKTPLASAESKGAAK